MTKTLSACNWYQLGQLLSVAILYNESANFQSYALNAHLAEQLKGLNRISFIPIQFCLRSFPETAD